MRRFLDLLLQHARGMLVGIVIAPALLGATTVALDRSRVVTASIRVEVPAFLIEVVPDHPLASLQGPTFAAGNLVQELLTTVWFDQMVVGEAHRAAGDGMPDPEQRANEVGDLQTHVSVSAVGPLVTLRYPTDHPERGVAVLRAVLTHVGDSLATIESQRAGSALEVARREAGRAEDEMWHAIEDLRAYSTSALQDGAAVEQDPQYRRLADIARSKSLQSQSLGDLARQSELASAAIPRLPATTAHIVDPPSVAPRTIWPHALGWALLGVIVIGSVEVTVVYLMALHEPRLRSGDDIRGQLDPVCVIDIPDVGPTVG